MDTQSTVFHVSFVAKTIPSNPSHFSSKRASAAPGGYLPLTPGSCDRQTSPNTFNFWVWEWDWVILVTDMVQCDLGAQKAMGERLLLGRCEAEVARPCPGPALSSPRLGSRAK